MTGPDERSPEDAELLRSLSRLVARLNGLPDERDAELTPLGEVIRDHMGVDPGGAPIISEHLPAHRLVDADIALDELSAADPDSVLLGVAGANRLHDDLATLIRNSYHRYSTDGPVEYVTSATGAKSTRQTASFALRLLHHDGEAVAVLQRAASPQTGRNSTLLEVLASHHEVASAFLVDLRTLMTTRSVVRGNVVTFARDEYAHGVGGLTFLDRPDVPASAVVLPDGVLSRIRNHVVGIGENAEQLLSWGQHLKRGVLLYGPPGTGKTLTVRHLLSAAPHSTVVLLQGGALGLVGEATRLARTMTPAIVVLEDVDLIASSRDDYGTQPLLFELLDALDGVDGDADIAFILTTNRAEALEAALAARPGRVDLAVEIPLPDLEARRALFHMYARDLPFSPEALDAAAEGAQGVTASFAKELFRRVVLRATLAGREVSDDDLAVSLAELVGSLTSVGRVLFGGAEAAEAAAEPWD